MPRPTNPLETPEIPLEKRTGKLNAWKALLIFLTYIIVLDLGQAIFGFAIGFYESANNTRLDDQIQILRVLAITFSITLAIGTAVTFAWLFQRDLFKGEQETKIGWSCGSWFYLKIGLAGGILLGGGTFLASTLLPIESNVNPAHFGLLATQGFSRIIPVVLMIVVAPIAEELLFRGVLFYGISRSWGRNIGGILVTLLFALLHIQKIALYWPAIFALIFLGVCTLYLRLRSKSLSPPVVLHSSYNLIIVISLLLQEN